MSALTLRRSTAAPSPRTDPLAGQSGYASVDLLPPSVRERRALQALRARLGLGLVIVALVVALGYIGAVVTGATAGIGRSGAQDTQDGLTAQIATYGEAARVRSDLTQVSGAVTTVMGSEVLWSDVVRSLTAALPPGVTLTSFAATPVDVTAAGSEVTLSPVPGAVATVTFSVTTPSLPDVAALLDALAGVPGVASPEISQASISGEDGSYTTSGSLLLDETALSGRYAQTSSTTEATS